jgi:hypothetical protein
MLFFTGWNTTMFCSINCLTSFWVAATSDSDWKMTPLYNAVRNDPVTVGCFSRNLVKKALLVCSSFFQPRY